MEADTRIEFSLSEASLEERQTVNRMIYLLNGAFLLMATINKLKFKVWHMDCVKFLKKIPRESLDSCVTDPP